MIRSKVKVFDLCAKVNDGICIDIIILKMPLWSTFCKKELEHKYKTIKFTILGNDSWNKNSYKPHIKIEKKDTNK